VTDARIEALAAWAFEDPSMRLPKLITRCRARLRREQAREASPERLAAWRSLLATCERAYLLVGVVRPTAWLN
jgi:hypothetical protein